MKKTALITLACLGLLCVIGIICFCYLFAPNTWSTMDISVLPSDMDTEWITEDGCAKIATHEIASAGEYTLPSGEVISVTSGTISRGILQVDNKSITGQWIFTEGPPTLYFVPAEPNADRIIFADNAVEQWCPVDCEENDNQITVTFRVEKTKYFKPGQEITFAYHKK